MTFIEKVQMLAKEKGVSVNKMMLDLGFSDATFPTWKRFKRIPKSKDLEKIADYFGVTTDYLLGKAPRDIIPIEDVIGKNRVKIPVLGTVRAGQPIEAIEEILDYEEIDAELAKTGEFFALKIKGDSMEPRIVEGDVVVVRQQPVVENGEIAVVLVNGCDATVKKFKKDERGIMLTAFNPAYEPMFFTSDEVDSLPVEIVGKVVELRGKF